MTEEIIQVKISDYYYLKEAIDDLLEQKASISHSHGNITNEGVITNQVNKNVVTDGNGKITTEAKPTIPVANATATNIKMNGTQYAGSLSSFAKADHVHPVDTSRAAASHTHSNYLTSHQDISGKEDTSNKTTTISSSSTDTQYPSAKATYTELNKKANSSHTHDDRYYTETEVNNKLNDKANTTHTHHDTDIDWNGTALANQVSLVDMAMYEEFSANRLAYFPGNNITIEYSTDGGSTWTTNTSASATEKLKLVTTSSNFTCGNNSTTNYAKNQLRVTIKLGETNANSIVYMDTRKLMLYLCTCGASGTQVQVSASTYKAPTTFTNLGNAVDVQGYSGWNSIPLAVTLGGYAGDQTNTSSARIQYFRLTFTQTGGTGNLRLQKIRIFGEKCWSAPSTLARSGHLYSYDENQNATFSNKITSTGFVKSGGTSSQLLQADGNVSNIETIPLTITYTDDSTQTLDFIVKK